MTRGAHDVATLLVLIVVLVERDGRMGDHHQWQWQWQCAHVDVATPVPANKHRFL